MLYIQRISSNKSVKVAHSSHNHMQSLSYTKKETVSSILASTVSYKQWLKGDSETRMYRLNKNTACKWHHFFIIVGMELHIFANSIPRLWQFFLLIYFSIVLE